MKTMFDAVKFAERVRIGLAIAHIGQNALARELGMSHGTMSRVCNGIGTLDLENYLRINAWLEKVEK